MDTLKTIYQQRIELNSSKLQKIGRRINILAILRLICFVALVYFIFSCAKKFQYLSFAILISLFVAFILLIKTYFDEKDKKLFLEQMLWVNVNELALLNGASNQFENGNQFSSREGYLDDLDIFGQHSLYHLLNRTTTSHGAGELSALLKQPLSEQVSIIDYQEAVKIVSLELDKRQQIIASGLLHKEKDGNLFGILNWLKSPSKLSGNWVVHVVRWGLPLYNLGGVLFYLQTGNYVPLGLGIIASWATIGSLAGFINRQHQLISQKQKILVQYAEILKIFSSLDPQQSVLLKKLVATSAEAHHVIRQFSQLTNWFDQRLNFMVNILLNSFFVYDLQCILALEHWKDARKPAFEKYVQCVGAIECLGSLGCFAFNHSTYVYPQIAADGLAIEAIQMAHPLIPGEERIANDFSIGEAFSIHLLTGSNMSGKTTFLRTAGINLVLAQIGSPVCAVKFSFLPMLILTSIRVSDSLQDHTSYFLAELKRLKEIITSLQSERPALVLVDEILRGTNSEDKQYGSEQFIRKLMQYRCLSIFATHDLALSKLENEFPNKIRNYCFESTIQNAEMSFDYQLRPGIAKNRNASFLMKKMGII